MAGGGGGGEGGERENQKKGEMKQVVLLKWCVRVRCIVGQDLFRT